MTRHARRLLVSHALSATAISLPWPALVALTWRLEPGLVGAVGAARMLPYLLLSWAIGGIGDRFGRVRVLAISAWSRVPLLLAATAFVLSGSPLPAAAVACLAVAAGTPAFPSLAAELPRFDPAAKTTGWLVTLEVSAFVVGPAVGGLLLGVGPAWAPALAAGLALGGAALLSGLPRQRRASEPAEVSWRVGIRALVRSRAVLGAIAVVMALNFVLATLGLALLPFTESVWGAGEPEFGLATAALGFGSLATPLLLRLAGPLLDSRTPLLALVVLPLVAVPWAPSWQVALAPLALFGATSTLVECETVRVLQLRAPERYRALSLGVADTAMIAAAAVGSFAAPVAASVLTAPGLVWCLAGVLGGVCWLGLGRRVGLTEAGR